jgi:hypothetical protein
MKNNRRHHNQCHQGRRETLNLTPGGIKNLAAFAESADIDVAADRSWFDKHPSANIRMRPISPREVKASGRPAGTPVTVVRRPGMLVRLIGTLNTGQRGGDLLPLPPPLIPPEPRS